MSRLYSPRDFGLNGSHRVALPDQDAPPDPDAYNQAMPASSSEGRAQRRTVTFAVDERKNSPRRARRSWSKKMRGLLKGRTKRKVADKGRDVVPAVTDSPVLGGIDAVVLGGPSYGVPAYSPPNPDFIGAGPSGTPPQATLPGWKHEGDEEPPRAGGDGLQGVFPEEETEEIDSAPPQLIRLTLLPKKAQSEVEVRQVTLRQKASGFGLHLSSGLPPIRVTYVEPGETGKSSPTVRTSRL